MITITSLFILLFTAMTCFAQTPPASPPMTGPEIFAKAGPAVFKLETRVIGGQAARSHGTAFAVNEDGYLITNFHVVADAVSKPEKYELILNHGQNETRATVEFVDAINDIALIKTPETFTQVLKLAAENSLQLGENIFALGFPKSETLSMSQGTFNGQRMMGFSTVTAASLPMNGGMSGGPCLNSRSEVVAVNRAMMVQAQNISYFSPLSALKRAVAQTQIPGARKPASNDWNKTIRSDIWRQETWAMKLNENKAPVRQKIGGISFTLPFANMQCGQDAEKNRLSKTEHVVCHNVSLALAGPNINALQIRTVAAHDTSPLSLARAFDAINPSYEALKKSHEKRGRGLASLQNQERCGARNVRNKQGLNLRVRYCSLPLPEFSGLYSTFLKIDVKSGKQETSIAQSYDGMTMETTGQMVEKFIDGISVDRNSGGI